jgi:hypothetical protein
VCHAGGVHLYLDINGVLIRDGQPKPHGIQVRGPRNPPLGPAPRRQTRIGGGNRPRNNAHTDPLKAHKRGAADE